MNLSLTVAQPPFLDYSFNINISMSPFTQPLTPSSHTPFLTISVHRGTDRHPNPVASKEREKKKEAKISPAEGSTNDDVTPRSLGFSTQADYQAGWLYFPWDHLIQLTSPHLLSWKTPGGTLI